MSSSSRPFVLVAVVTFVLLCTAWLISSGITVTSKQKRVDELASVVTSQGYRMKDLYAKRSRLVLEWLEEREKKAQARIAAAEARAQARAAAVLQDQTIAGASPAPVAASNTSGNNGAAEAKAELGVITAIRAAIEESRKLSLDSQAAFDLFDRLQSEVSNYLASQLLIQLKSEADLASEEKGQEERSKALFEQLAAFENLERELADARRAYHAAALERTELLASLYDLPLGFGEEPEAIPMFSSELALTKASR